MSSFSPLIVACCKQKQQLNKVSTESSWLLQRLLCFEITWSYTQKLLLSFIDCWDLKVYNNFSGRHSNYMVTSLIYIHWSLVCLFLHNVIMFFRSYSSWPHCDPSFDLCVDNICHYFFLKNKYIRLLIL